MLQAIGIIAIQWWIANQAFCELISMLSKRDENGRAWASVAPEAAVERRVFGDRLNKAIPFDGLRDVHWRQSLHGNKRAMRID